MGEYFMQKNCLYVCLKITKNYALHRMLHKSPFGEN